MISFQFLCYLSLQDVRTQGKQIIIENSSHMIPYDQPGAIVDVVQELVEQLRR